MPQTNKLRRGKRVKKVVPFADRKFSLNQVGKSAMSALSMAKHLAGIINAEKKFHDAQVGASFDYTGAVNCLTEVPGGSGAGQRNGNSIFLKGVLIRGNMEINASVTNTVMRIIVFQDTSPNPGTVTTADVLEEVGTGYAPYSPMNNVNRRRYKVLSTKMVTLNSAGESGVPIKAYVPLTTHCRWNSSTSTDLDKGHIYTLIISNQPTLSPSAYLQTRVYYYDN